MTTTFSIPFMFANLNLHTASIRYFSFWHHSIRGNAHSLPVMLPDQVWHEATANRKKKLTIFSPLFFSCEFHDLIEKKKREDRLASQKANEAIMQFVGDFVALTL
ncbi:hypothetical protein ZIOFF_025341 [Zingiber officinale]|uniref:Uncharacterized protein n=1 Tax=Zingiber officinale TaxID=94328 RepID=A0A8J5L6T3_ZINOF|nr:hypothetical protein ZIOFF_025341 [Zingiber officinale]